MCANTDTCYKPIYLNNNKKMIMIIIVIIIKMIMIQLTILTKTLFTKNIDFKKIDNLLYRAQEDETCVTRRSHNRTMRL